MFDFETFDFSKLMWHSDWNGDEVGYDDLANCLVAKGGKAARTNNFVLFDTGDYSKLIDSKDINHLVDSDIHIRGLTPLVY